jgi:hypothetical protein
MRSKSKTYLHQGRWARKELITSPGVLKHPNSKMVVRKELITSRGVLKHLNSKIVVQKELITSGKCISILSKFYYSVPYQTRPSNYHLLTGGFLSQDLLVTWKHLGLS